MNKIMILFAVFYTTVSIATSIDSQLAGDHIDSSEEVCGEFKVNFTEHVALTGRFFSMEISKGDEMMAGGFYTYWGIANKVVSGRLEGKQSFVFARNMKTGGRSLNGVACN